MAARVWCKYGRYFVHFKRGNEPARNHIKIVKDGEPRLFPISLEEENRVLRLLLYDLKQGYTKLSSL